MQSFEQRFGPQPRPYFDIFSPLVILGLQFVITILILITVHPPFINDTQGSASLRTIVGIGMISTMICVIAHNADASDIVRSTLDTLKNCMIRA